MVLAVGVPGIERDADIEAEGVIECVVDALGVALIVGVLLEEGIPARVDGVTVGKIDADGVIVGKLEIKGENNI